MWSVLCQSVFDKEKYDVQSYASKVYVYERIMEGKAAVYDAFLYGSWLENTVCRGSGDENMKESPFILSIMNFILMVLHHMERCMTDVEKFAFFSKAALRVLFRSLISDRTSFTAMTGRRD